MSDATRQRSRQYRIIEVLGKGGFGTVYRAKMEASGGFTKDVALKILNPDMEGMENVVGRLRDEARMLGLLRHRAIVQVDSLVKLQNRWAVVMEYVEGLSLSIIIKDHPVPPGPALEIVEEVCSALHFAYDRSGSTGEPLRLLHRDIKPGNIQITPTGEAKLLDFGIARAEFGNREAETRSVMFGSIPYMAPERMAFEDTHQGDVYSLGSTLYEILMGEPLGQAHVNPRKHEEKLRVTLERIDEKFGDPQLTELLKSTLAYEPEDRPTARELEKQARSIRRAQPEPWLREWAEFTLPPILASRTLETDDWTHQVLTEPTEAHLAGQNPEHRSSAQSIPNRQKAILKQSYSTNPPVRRSNPFRTFVKVFLWAVLLLILLGGIGTLLTLALGTGGIVALVNTSLWTEALEDNHAESFQAYIDLVDTLPVDDNMMAIRALLVDGRDHAAYSGHVSLLDMSFFEVELDNCLEDGLITPGERSSLERQYATMLQP